MVYTDAIKQQEAMMFMTKNRRSCFAWPCRGWLMLLFGLWRGEADTVFQKPSGCVWSVWALDKKKKKLSPLARFRGFIQAGATLLTNIHLPNFAKGALYQAAENTSASRG